MGTACRSFACALSLWLGLSAPALSQIDLTRAGIDPPARSGNWCFGDDHKLRGLLSRSVLIQGRSTSGQGALEGHLVLTRGGTHFAWSAGTDPLVRFTPDGSEPSLFGLSGLPNTPHGVYTVAFRAIGGNGAWSNEVSCRIDTYPVGVVPPELHPYWLAVQPESFLTVASLPAGFVPRGAPDPRQQGPFATSETLIKLEPRHIPDRSEPDRSQRRCVFSAISSTGVQAFVAHNDCDNVVTRLPAGEYTLRLGFGYPTTDPANYAFVERRGYKVVAAATTVVGTPTDHVTCLAPCSERNGICIMPRASANDGGGFWDRLLAFACRDDGDCASADACIDGRCVTRCWPGTGCPQTCDWLGNGSCVKRVGFLHPINRYCTSANDCDPGYDCLQGQCRQPCD